MMKIVFDVYDKVSKLYSDPVVVVNFDVYARNLLDAEFIRNHLDDFSVYELGTFDDVVGKLVLYPTAIIHELGSLNHGSKESN
nr:MAG TPA: hypothetical protein [Microviridae sp.]